MWSIAAIHAFHDSDYYHLPTIEAFPPKQKPLLEDIVFRNLVDRWDTMAGISMARCNTDVAILELMRQRQVQLSDWMYNAVKASA